MQGGMILIILGMSNNRWLNCHQSVNHQKKIFQKYQNFLNTKACLFITADHLHFAPRSLSFLTDTF